MSPPPFEVLLPEIERRSSQHYSRFAGDERDERVAESVAQAWKMYESAVKRGRTDFTPCSLA